MVEQFDSVQFSLSEDPAVGAVLHLHCYRFLHAAPFVDQAPCYLLTDGMAQPPSVPLLAYLDDEIIAALRHFTVPSDVARLHDSLRARVFDLLVNITSDSQSYADGSHTDPSATTSASGQDSAQPASSSGAQFLADDDDGQGDGGAAYPSAGGSACFDVGLSPRSKMNPPWTSRDGWNVRIRLPQSPC